MLELNAGVMGFELRIILGMALIGIVRSRYALIVCPSCEESAEPKSGAEGKAGESIGCSPPVSKARAILSFKVKLEVGITSSLYHSLL